MANFTNAEASASKVLYINKKTKADGSLIGFSCGVVDGDGNHYSMILKGLSADADKAAIKTALKAYLCTIGKTPLHESTKSSSLLSDNDASESLN